MKKYFSPITGAVLLSLTFGASAQSNGGTKINLAEGLTLFPSVGFSFGRDGNLFLSNANQKSTNVYTLSPTLKLEMRTRPATLVFDLSTVSTFYDKSSSDNFTNIKFGVGTDLPISDRMGLKLGADYVKGSDPRGSTDRVGASEPDLYRTSGANGTFSFGAKEAAGRFEVDAGFTNKRYTNNRASTIGSDRDNSSFGARFFAKIAPKTSFLVEAKTEKLDYVSSTSSLDSTQRGYSVGVTWDATAATSGIVKVGQIRKTFASGARKGESSSGWDAAVNWAPLTYSKFTFNTAKQFTESTGLGDYIVNKRYAASWNHEWNQRFSSAANISRSEDQFVNGNRNDSTDSIGFRLSYRAIKWLSISGGFTNADRESNTSSFRYKKNTYSLGVDATL